MLLSINRRAIPLGRPAIPELQKGMINYGFGSSTPVVLAVFGVLLERRSGPLEKCIGSGSVTDFL